MNKIFACSDIHFGHKNIIRYADRPFDSVESMDTHIINAWNKRVGVDDTVYFLGDFAMGPGVDDGFIIDKLNLLHGKILVVLGNHDQPSPKWGVSGLEELCHYVKHVDVMVDSIHEVNIEGRHFVMCHYPMSDWNGKFKGSIHLHGHTHTQYRDYSKHNDVDNRYDIGVDMYGGPVEITADCRFLDNPRGWK